MRLQSLIIILFLIGGLFVANAATILFPYQGGTGIGSATISDVGKFLKVSDDNPFTYILDSVAGGGDFPFTPTTNFNQAANATTTALWLQGSPYSLFSSSTSAFSNLIAVNSTTTNATTTSLFSTTASTTNLSGQFINGFSLSPCSGSDFLQWSGGSFDCNTPSGAGTVTSISTTWPITGGTITTTGTLGFNGLSTSTNPTIGQLPYWTGVNTLGSVATGTISVPAGLTITPNRSAVGGATAIALDTGYIIPLQSVLDAKALGDTTMTIAGTANQLTSSAGAQDLSANRTWTLSLPNHVIFPGSINTQNASSTNATTTSLAVLDIATTSNLYASNIVQVQGVPFSLPPCAKNDAVLFNGTSLVCDAQGTNFTFSIASFSDGEATTQLIGAGTFQAQSTMAFTASYNNGPPTTATLAVSTNGGAYSNIGAMTSPAYTSGTNSTAAISYPSAKDQTLQFRLSADDGVDSSVLTDTAITFRNLVYTGCGTKANTYSEADIEALTGTQTATINVSKAINCGAGQYIVHSYPASYTNMDEGADYEIDGLVDFKFNSIALATINDSRTLSITNSAGYAENYEVYVSTLANLGSGTFVANTVDQTIDKLYYGITTKTSTFLESDVEGLANSPITNDNTQVWNSVTAGAGEYLLFAFPVRLGTVTFWVGGIEGGFQAAETVSVTNANGWNENYLVYRSTNSNLGATVVTTT